MSSLKNWCAYSTLFLVGVLFLFFRNPDPIINPVVYAEDGTWVALGLREGWISAFVFSREDYFVFLNTLLLYISSVISAATSGGIEHLPYAIAFVSYSFYSAFSLLAFITIKQVSSTVFAAFGFLLVLMIPLGSTQNEIIGRILQIGFFMPALAVMLFFWRDRCESILNRVAIDFAIFISAGTNPVVFVFAFVYFLHELFLNKFELVGVLKKNALLVFLLSALAIAILPRLGGHGGIHGDLVVNNLIEAVVSRSILFSFVFPWYGILSNAICLLILSIFILIIFVAIKASDSLEAKKLIYAMVIAIAIYTLLAMLMRPGLTGILNQYRTTFPDRYFMGINVLVSMLAVLSVSQLVFNVKTRMLGALVGAFFIFVYIYGLSEIVEFKGTKMPIRGYFSFKDQICLSDDESNLRKIQIYPEPWSMLVPSEYLNKANCKFKSYEELGIARPGDEYKMVATPPLEKNKSVYLGFFGFPSHKPLSKVEILFGTYQRVNQGDAQLVLKSANGGRQLINFTLPDLLDNQYQAFDVPDGVYVSGEILAITGQGVSVWESHHKDGKALACIKFIFSDGSRGFTPGCPYR